MSITIGDIPVVDLVIEQGDDYTYPLELVDDDGPINLTGSMIIFTLKNDPTDADGAAVYQQKVSSHVDATNGISKITISKTVTRGFTPGANLYHDIQITDANGLVETLIKGRAIVNKDISIAYN